MSSSKGDGQGGPRGAERFFCALGIFLAAAVLFPRLLPYPELEKFLAREYSDCFFDRNGVLLQVAPVSQDGLRREWNSLGEIPLSAQDIVLRAEDRRFFLHGGIDPLSALRAALQNIAARRTVRGASTISMQLAHLISGTEKDRSLAAKVLDVINAYRIEAKLSKTQILELYMNNVPFGSGIEGFPSAARSFFGSELKSLSREQAACLAVVPRRPALYNPAANPEQCALAASRLVNSGEESLLFAANSAFKYRYPYYMPHYVRHVQDLAAGRPAGRRVFLSADLRLYEKAQQLADEAFRSARNSRIENAAVIVLENSTGKVLCWLSRGEFDGVLFRMQPGSSMKPFLYALALEGDSDGAGFRPNMVLGDVPVEFGGENLYIPTNFNNRYNGPVRFRVALASSLNVPAVKILNSIGVERYRDFLIEAGFGSLKEGANSDPGLALALGGAEVTLEELARAFSIFPNDGLLPDGRRIIRADTARLVCSILSDKASRALGFGYSQTFESRMPAIFKTGTANQYQNITALGATRNFTVGVWMGNFSGETVVGKTGSSLPAGIARQLLEMLEPDAPEFELPEGYEEIRVCSLSAMESGDSCPNSVYEFARKGEARKSCDWHSRSIDGDGRIVTTYPSEFEAWLGLSQKDGAIAYGGQMLEIRTPQDGAIFYYDAQNRQIQAVPVEISGGSGESLRASYDGVPLERMQRPFSFLLPLERGRHTLEAACGGEQCAVEFWVK